MGGVITGIGISASIVARRYCACWRYNVQLLWVWCQRTTAAPVPIVTIVKDGFTDTVSVIPTAVA